MLLEATWKILYTLSSTNAENQRCVVFCSHGHNFETQCGDPVPVEWSTCQLSENATCGQGIRTRLLSCVRSDGKPVSVDQCEQVSCVYFYPTPMALFVCLFVWILVCNLHSAWYKWQSDFYSSQLRFSQSRGTSIIQLYLTRLNLVKMTRKGHFALGKWIH